MVNDNHQPPLQPLPEGSYCRQPHVELKFLNIVRISAIRDNVHHFPLMPQLNSSDTTYATRWTSMLSNFFYVKITWLNASTNQCGDIYTSDECLLWASQIWNRSCASRCIIDVSRDLIVKTIHEIDGTVQNTFETIKTKQTIMKGTSPISSLQWQNTSVRCCDDAITWMNGWKNHRLFQMYR
jgi:hypothetical protein